MCGCQRLCGKYAVFTSYQTGASRQIQTLCPVLHASCASFTHPSLCISLYLTLSLSLSCTFFFSSIWAFQLPFRPQKYDVWCSNDLQTVSGNAHHESWKCIFPFPLWSRLHAHREIYAVIGFSFSVSLSFSLISSLCAVLIIYSFPFIFLLD